jgi:DNA (cytosine-5)-methyltransferase 1
MQKNMECLKISERIFMVSVRDDLNQKFYFPQPFKLEKRLKDILEDKVDEKYYLSEKCVKGFEEHNKNHIAKGTGFLFIPKTGNDIGCCVRSNSALAPTDNTIIERFNDKRLNKIVSEQKDKIQGKEPKYLDTYNQAVRDEAGTISTRVDAANCTFVTEPTIAAMRGRNPENTSDRSKGTHCEQRLEVGENISNTLHASSFENTNQYLYEPNRKNNLEYDNFRIRKLTPKECFRLMDVPEKDIDKLMNSGISNSQLYKLAGNSIVVSCLYHIFRKLFIETENDSKQLELF